MERYLIVLKSYKRMPFALEQTLRENVRPMTVCKGDIIQPVGTLSDTLYFVEKGLFRLFLNRWDGKDVSLRFKREDQFIISLDDIFSRSRGGRNGIEALEDGVLWLFPGPLVSELTQKYTEFVIQMGVIVTKDWISLEEHSRCSFPDGGSFNYERLCKDSPELLDRVPIPFLASYTNMSEEMFRHLHGRRLKSLASTARRRKR